MPELENYEAKIESSLDSQRKQLTEKIVKEAPHLVDELLAIIYSDSVDAEGRPIVDAKVKLQAIGMLLDRSQPKLAVDHGKQETIEESGSRKRIRKEIEEMMKQELNKGTKDS